MRNSILVITAITSLLLVAIVMSVVRNRKNDQTLLFEAIKRKDVSAVRDLLSNGDIELDPPSGIHEVNKPLAYAAAYGNLDIVKLLISAGSDLNGKVAYGDVPLIKADEKGNDDIAEYLINVGADVNVPNAFGVSPFIGICGSKKKDLVRLAFDKGGDVNATYISEVGSGTGLKNYSPLTSAIESGDPSIVEFLLQHGADPHALDHLGKTPLQAAESLGNKRIIQIVLGDVNSQVVTE